MKRSLLALFAAAFALTGTAHAKSLTFNFDVFSSGNTIYACNAGLRHVADPNYRVCYLAGTQTSCTPGTSQNCVCTGDGPGVNEGNWGNHNLDQFRATYYSWDARVSPPPTPASPTQFGAPYPPIDGSTNYSKLFSDADAWFHPIRTLEFDLASELYGAEYFVDICYLGSQIQPWWYWTVNSLGANVVVTDMANHLGQTYASLSGLLVSAEYSCDTVWAGTYQQGTTDGTPATKDETQAKNDVNIGNGTPGSAGGDFHGTSGGAVNLSGYGATANVQLFGNFSATPYPIRACKVRYYFKESSKMNMRAWQLHGAHVTTQTTFETP